jgi:hypothetical protein
MKASLPARRTIRVGLAVLSIATAAIYLGIGLGVLRVVDAAEGAPDLFGFGASAAAAFLFGTVLLLRFDHRGLWVLGAILQVSVVVMYFAVAPQRTPSFEAWGLLIKVLQVAIFAGLLFLVVGTPRRDPVEGFGPVAAP